MADDGRVFGSQLADCRRLTGLSQQELAEQSGLSVRTIGNLEQGRARWPHPDTMRRLADALALSGVARDEFMAGAGGRAGRSAGMAAPASGDQSLEGAETGALMPRQLPPGVRHFTGRKAELDFLSCLPDAPGAPDGGGTVVISAIGGTAGVGKTALAIHWAHQAAARFPDGQLYVNLRGFDPSGTSVAPAEALRGFLDALGVPPERVPPGADAQAGLYRSLLVDRKMLIVLDNARDCLITEHAPGRYAFHDLLRAYAAAQARKCDPEPDREAATGRVLDHYLHTAARAAVLLQPSREKIALAPPRPGAAPERPGDYRQALAWFGAEHQVLLAALTLAAEMGADSHAWQLPWVMTAFLYRRGYLHERVTTLGVAVAAATRLDDTLGQAMTLRALGSACIDAADYEQARAHLERCLLQYRRLDDRRGEAWAQLGLSRLAEVQGRYANALGHGEQALRLFHAIGHQTGEAQMLNNVGWCHARLGDYQRARGFCEQSLDLIATLGGCDFECQVWDTFGYIELHLGDFARAVGHFESALGLCREYGDRYSEAEILIHVGDARHAAGELPQARQAWQQALAIYDDIEHPDAEKVRAKLASTEGSQ